MTNRDRTIILLRSRTAWFPARARRDYHQAGFVHGILVRESCSDCLANDKRLASCEACGGRGYLEVMRERDPYAIDKVQPYGLTGDHHERTRAVDAAIDRAQHELRRFPGFRPQSPEDELAEADKHPYLWERERDRHYRQGDYAHLDRALEWLGAKSSTARRLVEWVYEFEVILEPHLSREVRVAARASVDALTLRMPDPVRVPPWLDPSPAARAYAKRRAA